MNLQLPGAAGLCAQHAAGVQQLQRAAGAGAAAAVTSSDWRRRQVLHPQGAVSGGQGRLCKHKGALVVLARTVTSHVRPLPKTSSRSFTEPQAHAKRDHVTAQLLAVAVFDNNTALPSDLIGHKSAAPVSLVTVFLTLHAGPHASNRGALQGTPAGSSVLLAASAAADRAATPSGR